jgi:hypothetical protein
LDDRKRTSQGGINKEEINRISGANVKKEEDLKDEEIEW